MMIIIYNFILIFFFLTTFPGSYFVLLYYLKKTEYELPNKKYYCWIHCASLGEIKIALRLIKEIKIKTNISENEILVTVTNPKIKNLVKPKFSNIYVLPIDFCWFTKKFVDIVQPKVLLILETELWANYIYFAKKVGAKIFLLNGRISRNTLVFFKMFKILFNPILTNIDYISVREKIDFQRFSKIYPKEKIVILGNMKYDDIEEFNLDITKETFNFNNTDFILTFGSIRDGEEKFVLETITKLRNKNIKNVKFIIAPRHLKNVCKLGKILSKNNISFVKRTELMMTKNNKNKIDCLLIDTLGELKKFYFISDIIFVGGSILPYGGQSIIEPASLGKVVIFGPHMENFLEISQILKNCNAGYLVNTVDELVNIVLMLQKDNEKINVVGSKAKEIVKTLQGATKKNVEFVFKHIETIKYV